MNIESLLGRLSGGESLSQEEMCSTIDSVMQGGWQPNQIALLLTALRAKGETVEEIAGAASAMRKNMTPIRSDHPRLLDTCGTGGDGSGTFNISTAAALVSAAAGAAVAKHGNRSISSRSGSADVLAELGVNVEAPLETVEKCLAEVGICFCFAPQLHPAMRHVGAVRKSLGVPTIFNLLGPLCNPASAPFQLLGVGRTELRTMLAEALRLLEAERAVVVCGNDGLDEVTLAGATSGTLVEKINGGLMKDFQWTPEEFGLNRAELTSMTVDGPSQSAAVVRCILDGEAGPARDIVVLNAAAALWTVGVDPAPLECAKRAAEAIDSGAARDRLAQLVKASNS